MSRKLKTAPSSLPRSSNLYFQPSSNQYHHQDQIHQTRHTLSRSYPQRHSPNDFDDFSSIYLTSSYGNILTPQTEVPGPQLEHHESVAILDTPSITMGQPSPNSTNPTRPSYGTMLSNESLSIEQLEGAEVPIAQSVAPTEICTISTLEATSNAIQEYCATATQTEADRLLGNTSKWSETCLDQETTWQVEAKILTKSALPLVVTLALQYSLTLASVFSAGKLGSDELAACSLANMTANITGIAMYNGMYDGTWENFFG